MRSPSEKLELSALQFDEETQTVLACARIVVDQTIDVTVGELKEEVDRGLASMFKGLEKAIRDRELAYAEAKRAEWEVERDESMRDMHEALIGSMAQTRLSPPNIMDSRDDDAVPTETPAASSKEDVIKACDHMGHDLNKRRQQHAPDVKRAIRFRMNELENTLLNMMEDMYRDTLTTQAETRRFRRRRANSFQIEEGRNWQRPPQGVTGRGGWNPPPE